MKSLKLRTASFFLLLLYKFSLYSRKQIRGQCTEGSSLYPRVCGGHDPVIIICGVLFYYL